MQTSGRELVAAVGAVAALTLFSSPIALVVGTGIALTLGNPRRSLTLPWGRRVLTASIVLLGAGTDFFALLASGRQGVGVTFVGITATLGVGWGLSRLLGVGKKTGLLVSVGTAICGGSAIAAVAPAISADEEEVSVALAIVFALNALALWIFPWLGRLYHLTPSQFGYWSALAIHDTSSVVGAAWQFGPHAAALATTVKLTRALWILPVTLVLSLFHRSGASRGNGSLYGMLGGFLAVAVGFHFIPWLAAFAPRVDFVAHRLLVLALFFVGLNIDPFVFRRLGPRPLVLGISLWFLVAWASLAWVRSL